MVTKPASRELVGAGGPGNGCDGQPHRDGGNQLEVPAQLAAERRRVETLVEHLPVGIGFCDSSGRIIIDNPEWRRLVPGPMIPSADDLHGDQWIVYAADGRQCEPFEFPGARALRGETATGIEVLHRTSTGERWLRVNSVPFRDPTSGMEGALTAVVEITVEKRAQEALRRLNDTLEERIGKRTRALSQANERLTTEIKERQQAEEALRQSEKNYRNLYDKTPVPMQWADGESRLTSVNDAWVDLLGYERDEVIGRSMFDFYAPASADYWRKHGWPAFVAKGEVRAIERQFQRKSGEILDVLLSARVERDAEGRFVRGIGVLMDITAQRKAQRERDRYFEMSQDFLVIAGFDGRFRDVNPAAIEAFGLTRDELLSMPFLDLVHPEDRETMTKAIDQLRAGAASAQAEIRFRYRDDAWHWSQWRATAIADEGLVYGVGRDIHEQRQVEEALRRAQRMEAIGHLTGGVAHDFNNLLTTVIGNLDRIVRRSRPDDPRRLFAESALEGAERGARLTKQLLAFARRQRLTPEVVDLGHLFDQAAGLYKRALGETIELTLDIPADLWSCRVDRSQVESAVLNLILNARDALPRGGRVTLNLTNTAKTAGQIPDLPAGEYVRLSVHDSGSGMMPDVTARAFEPFFTTKGVGKGSGLGLSQVYGFATQSGGTARIESGPGLGTTVYVYLPRALEPVKTQVSTGPGSAGPLTARTATILVVEDDVGVRQTTVDMLTERGHRVLVSGTGHEALTILRDQGPVDLLLTDIVMPGGMSGIELAHEARRLHHDQAVILTTGYASELDAEELAHARFTLLRKPYRPSELSEAVRKALPKREARR